MTPAEVANIIAKEPLIASLLYDIDLLPEQIKEGDKRRYNYMLNVIGHMERALQRPSEADQRDAARYRWLRDQRGNIVEIVWNSLYGNIYSTAMMGNVNAAIDAAMRQSDTEGSK